MLYVVSHGITLYQMNFKSAILVSFLEEKKVYVKQPPEFEDLIQSEYVFKLKKSLYSLKQALRA